ncbi:ABC transporter substrate-binding protein [Glaciibacter superstes]|uniref:ABC transporter substrate-binding protein n=1 Tax=Glaciibacter superstes TaxID=501023 RepID=UPI0003B61A32|nr:ABC transporter substrate-binding protein [Glaciibacter superstes]
MKKPRATVLVAAAAVTALMLAGCAQDAGSGRDEEGAAGGNVDVRMAYVAFAGIAPTLLGIQDGIYEDHGLNVKGEVAVSPAAIIAGLTNGELDIGFTTIITLVSAVQQGVGIKCLASADGVGDSSPEIQNNGLVVAPDSPITSAADLEGKKVGVLALGSLNHLVATDLIARAGGDPSTVEFVQLPFPQVEGALTGKQVDAGIITEPFTSPLMEKGFKSLGWSEAPGNLMSERTTKCYAASEAYIEKNPETVAKFIAAHDETLTYAQEHVDEALATLPQILDISDEAAKGTVTGAIWKPGIAPEDIEYVQELMLKYGWVEEELSVDDYKYTP